MKNLLPNDWDAIRCHYEWAAPIILAGEKWEWAMDPYAWEECRGINMTPIEAWLWADIRQANAIFYPQYPVGRFFVDFANPLAKVAIECDGYHYHLDREKDRERDLLLQDMGWQVYRIRGVHCMTDSDAETGAPGPGLTFIREIAEHHRISRHHKPKRENASFGLFEENAA